MDLQEQISKERSKVFVERYDLTVREIVNMATRDIDTSGISGTEEEERKEMNISPVYQRKFRWGERDESRLIESIYLGIPVPPIFVAEEKYGTWEVVDGLQRISTLIHFCRFEEGKNIINKDEPLRLEGLDKVDSLEGRTFEDIPTPLRLSFEKKKLRVTLISETTDDEIRYDVFERLNEGGIKLEPQEVRACLNRGEFMRLLEDLSKNDHFKEIIKLPSDKQDDGTKEEIVLKTIAYKEKIEDYKNNVKPFLDRFVEESKDNVDIEKERRVFSKAVEKLEESISTPFLRRNVHTTPINQLEGVLVAATKLVEEGVDTFEPQSGWEDDSELVDNSRGGTNARNKLFGRISRAKELLQGAEVTN